MGRVLAILVNAIALLPLISLSGCLGRGERLPPGWREIASVSDDPFDLPEACSHTRFRPAQKAAPDRPRCYRLQKKTAFIGEPYRILLSPDTVLVDTSRLSCRSSAGDSVPCPVVERAGVFQGRAYTSESGFAGYQARWWLAEDGTIGIRWTDAYGVQVACLPRQHEKLPTTR